MRVAVAYAYSSKEHGSLRMLRNEAGDRLPQHQQRRILPLVFGTHKRTSQFERRSHPLEQFCLVVKERVRIEASYAVLRNDFLRVPCPVRADQFPLNFVPEHEMPVATIETVEVGAAAGSFSGRAKGHFPQPTHFFK